MNKLKNYIKIMSKLIISESQLNLLSEYISSNKPTDLTLGMLYMVGVKLSGHNKVIGQDSINDPKIIKQIDNIMSDTDKLNDFIDKIEGKIPNIRKLLSNKLGDIESLT